MNNKTNRDGTIYRNHEALEDSLAMTFEYNLLVHCRCAVGNVNFTGQILTQVTQKQSGLGTQALPRLKSAASKAYHIHESNPDA